VRTSVDWRMRSGTADQVRSLQDQIVRENVGLVHWVAKRVATTLPIEDRLQEGTIGLLRATELFDPDRGVRFGSYAIWWIRQAIRRAADQSAYTIRLPSQQIARHRKLLAAEAEAARLGLVLTDREFAEATGLPADSLLRLRALTRPPVSSDALEIDRWRVDEHRGDASLAMEARHDVATAMASLDPRSRLVLSWLFGLAGAEELTLAQIARRLDLSRERVRQIRDKALARARLAWDGEKLSPPRRARRPPRRRTAARMAMLARLGALMAEAGRAADAMACAAAAMEGRR